jgi:hypothetical protein
MAYSRSFRCTFSTTEPERCTVGLADTPRNYDRPNAPWRCGRPSADCPLGPDRHGLCRTVGECLPTKTQGRFICTRRSEPCDEGPAADGRCSRPTPRCIPQRGSRSRRVLSLWILFAGTLWLMLLGIAVGWWG